jgi:hypothetical protein
VKSSKIVVIPPAISPKGIIQSFVSGVLFLALLKHDNPNKYIVPKMKTIDFLYVT